jgi:pantoate--beta-alanine ligase
MTMMQIDSPTDVRAECERQRRQGRRVGFVPTMGYLHAGHLSLMRRAAELADFVVVSIFVNPTQFGPHEDLARYPRDLAGDLAKCRSVGVELVFVPEPPQIYPAGYQTFVAVERLGQGLCGARRPGHFRGVATVVTKLLNIVGPCVAVFGEKDYQQLQLIRRVVQDLDLPVEVASGPIVREPDGLAMSSRNAYLQPEERRAATCLHRALQAVAAQVRSAGILPAAAAVSLARAIIDAEPTARVDYVEARDAVSLEETPHVGGGRSVLALAVCFGKTRLIDNLVL